MEQRTIELERTKSAAGDAEGSISVADLRPGDVLLYHRSSLLGKVMRAFDDSDVSHAALYLGDGVAEAIGDGVLGHTLAESLGEAPGDYIVVHRFDDGGPPRSLEEVVERARAYLGLHLRYGYSTVATIALLALTRRIPLTRKARLLLRLILDRAAAELFAPTEEVPRRLICSELVYRCFSDATPTIAAAAASAGVYRIEIVGATVLEGLGLEATRPIEPDSLLGRARGSWNQPTLESATDAAPPRDVNDQDIERAAADYLQEKESDSDPTLERLGDPVVRLEEDPELLGALRRFASAVAGNGGQLESTRDSVPSFESVAAVVANFVSPGDLRRSPSLVHQGHLELDGESRRYGLRGHDVP